MSESTYISESIINLSMADSYCKKAKNKKLLPLIFSLASSTGKIEKTEQRLLH